MALTDNLVYVYQFNEGATVDAVDTLGGTSLTQNGTIPSATGIVLGARDIEADTTDNFSAASSSVFQAGDIDISWRAVFKLESLVQRGVFSKWGDGDASGNEYLLYRDSDGNLYFFVRDAANANNASVNSGSTIAVDTWYDVICGHDSVNNLLFLQINGGTRQTTSFSGGIRSGTNTFRAGSWGTVSPLDGLIDELWCWKNRVISSAEAITLWNGGDPLTYAEASGGTWIPPVGAFCVNSNRLIRGV
jgi:hypothetical protein